VVRQPPHVAARVVAVVDVRERPLHGGGLAAEDLLDIAVLLDLRDGQVAKLEAVVEGLLLVRGLLPQLAGLVVLMQVLQVCVEDLDIAGQLVGGLAAQLVGRAAGGQRGDVLAAQLVEDRVGLRGSAPGKVDRGAVPAVAEQARLTAEVHSRMPLRRSASVSAR
jgi:hypothetical protein